MVKSLRINRFPVWLAVVCLLATEAAAGPWVPRAGAYYFQVSYAFQTAHQMFDSHGVRGRLADRGEYADNALEFYGEVGVGRKLALIAAAPFKWLSLRRVMEPDFRSSGAADGLVGVRYGGRLMGLAVAAQLNVRSALDYDAQAVPALGDDQTDFEAHVLAGGSWMSALPGYLQGDVGRRTRAGRAADEWVYAVEAGIWVAPSVMLSGFVRGTRSGGETLLRLDQVIPDASTSESYTSAGLGVAYRVMDRLDVRAEYGGLTGGRNTLALSGWRFGVSLSRD